MFFVTTTLKWAADKFLRAVAVNMDARAQRAGLHMLNTLRAKVSGPPSLPYHYPGMRTGNFRNRLSYRVDKAANGNTRITLLAGAKYSEWLNLGTGRMKPRPWRTLIFRETWPTVMRIMTGKG